MGNSILEKYIHLRKEWQYKINLFIRIVIKWLSNKIRTEFKIHLSLFARHKLIFNL